MSKRKKKGVGIGVCSPYIRPQKYETRDPFPYLNFDEPMPKFALNEVVIVSILVICLTVATGLFLAGLI